MKDKPKLNICINNLICHQITIFIKPYLNNKKNKNNFNNDLKINQQKFDKISKEKNIKIDDNKNKILSVLNNNNKESKINKNIEEKNVKNIDADIYNNKTIENSGIKKGKIRIIKSIKFNQPTIKLIDDIKYKTHSKNNFEEYNTYKSAKNILNKSDKKTDDAFYKRQKTLSKKAQIKYKKTKININNNYNNNRYESHRLIKKINSKNKSPFKDYRDYKKKIKKEDNLSVNYTTSKKKNYIERYKEAIEKIMKNDDSIFNDESQIFYIKNNSKNILKNDINIIKKRNKENKPKRKLNENISEKTFRNNIKMKKNIYGSCDNIHKKNKI